VKSKLSVLSKLTIFKEEVGLSYALKVGPAYALSTTRSRGFIVQENSAYAPNGETTFTKH
jgi:hypothetical protein